MRRAATAGHARIAVWWRKYTRWPRGRQLFAMSKAERCAWRECRAASDGT